MFKSFAFFVKFISENKQNNQFGLYLKRKNIRCNKNLSLLSFGLAREEKKKILLGWSGKNKKLGKKNILDQRENKRNKKKRTKNTL